MIPKKNQKSVNHVANVVLDFFTCFIARKHPNTIIIRSWCLFCVACFFVFLRKMFDNSFVCLFDHLGHIIIDDDDYAKFFVAVFRSSSWWSIFICIVFDVASVAIAINSINRSRFVQMKLFFPLKFLICSLKNHYIIHSFRKFQKAAASVQTNPIKYHHLWYTKPPYNDIIVVVVETITPPPQL